MLRERLTTLPTRTTAPKREGLEPPEKSRCTETMRATAVVTMLLCLCACTPFESESASMSDSIPDVALRIPDDPCQLLTEGDVSRAMDVPVVRSGPVPEGAMILPGGPPLCDYVMRGRYSTVVVAVEPRDLVSFVREGDGDPGNIDPITGLGDEAFASAMGSVWVRVGEGYFALGVQLDPGRQAIRDLRELAGIALRSLPRDQS